MSFAFSFACACRIIKLDECSQNMGVFCMSPSRTLASFAWLGVVAMSGVVTVSGVVTSLVRLGTYWTKLKNGLWMSENTEILYSQALPINCFATYSCCSCLTWCGDCVQNGRCLRSDRCVQNGGSGHFLCATWNPSMTWNLQRKIVGSWVTQSGAL